METSLIEVHEGFSAEITPETSEALIGNMVEHTSRGVDRVVLDVSSPGGEVASAMNLYETLRSVPFELVTRNVGAVASMGNLVFLAGDTRLASNEATFLMHPIKIEWVAGNRDIAALRRERTRLEYTGKLSPRLREVGMGIFRLEREEREVREIIKHRSKLSGTEISRLVEKGEPISADFAQNAGIVHAIIPPVPPV